MYQLALFRLRERGLLELLTEQISNLMSKGIPSKKAFNMVCTFSVVIAKVSAKPHMREYSDFLVGKIVQYGSDLCWFGNLSMT